MDITRLEKKEEFLPIWDSLVTEMSKRTKSFQEFLHDENDTSTSRGRLRAVLNIMNLLRDNDTAIKREKDKSRRSEISITSDYMVIHALEILRKEGIHKGFLSPKTPTILRPPSITETADLEIDHEMSVDMEQCRKDDLGPLVPLHVRYSIRLIAGTVAKLESLAVMLKTCEEFEPHPMNEQLIDKCRDLRKETLWMGTMITGGQPTTDEEMDEVSDILEQSALEDWSTERIDQALHQVRKKHKSISQMLDPEGPYGKPRRPKS